MMCVLCVQRVSRQNLRLLKHMHMKRDIALRSPMPVGLGPLELIIIHDYGFKCEKKVRKKDRRAVDTYTA